ncbi:hypothetical protein ID866_11441 [Astraeus odoratus]|nr:hypothetical protein ID866_11441 [Astraeus odoratus]
MVSSYYYTPQRGMEALDKQDLLLMPFAVHVISAMAERAILSFNAPPALLNCDA